MKWILLLVFTLLPAQALFAQGDAAPQDAAKTVQPSAEAAAPAPLRNEDVLKMIGAGLASEVVVAKIESSASDFDTSPAALQRLKAGGVPDAVLVAMVMASKPSARAPARLVETTIPNGTIVDVETAFDVNSQFVRAGDKLSFRVVNPVKVGDRVVIAAGATATGRVERAKRGGHWGRAGLLVWAIQEVTAVDGSRIPLQMMVLRERGDSKSAKVATQMVVLGALTGPFAPLALFGGFKRGENACIPAGKRFEVFVRGDSRVMAAESR